MIVEQANPHGVTAAQAHQRNVGRGESTQRSRLGRRTRGVGALVGTALTVCLGANPVLADREMALAEPAHPTETANPDAAPPNAAPVAAEPARAGAAELDALVDVVADAATVPIDALEDDATRALRDQLRELQTQRYLRKGVTAIYIVDAKTGAPLFAAQEDELLNPASNVKLISTATALDALGPNWRYATRLIGPAPDGEGAIAGDVYLLGSYDPTLRASDIWELAAGLGEAGVARIDGDIVVGSDALRDSLGRIRATFRIRGERAGEAPEVRIDPGLDFLTDEVREQFLAETFELDNRAETLRARKRARMQVRVRMDEDALPYRVEVSGHVSKRRRDKKRRRIPSPQLYTGQILRAALLQAGVEVSGAVRVSELGVYTAQHAAAGSVPVELARHESKPISALVARINKRSLNALADRVLMTAGAALYGGPPTMENGVRAMHAWLRDHAGIDPAEVVLDTGSGLSYRTELSARHIVGVLRTAAGYRASEHPLAPQPRMSDMLPPSLARAAGALGSARVAQLDNRLAKLIGDETSVVFGREAGGGFGRPDGHDDDDDDDDGDEDSELDDALDEAAAGSSLEQVFLHSLAVGGIDGTLRGRLRPVRGQVHGKTGTLTRVIALSGIVEHGDQAVAFSLVTNGHTHRKRRHVRRAHDKIVEALHDYLRARSAD